MNANSPVVPYSSNAPRTTKRGAEVQRTLKAQISDLELRNKKLSEDLR